jgi:hypothetical protein
MTDIAQFTPPHPLKTAVLFMVFNRLGTAKQVFQEIRQAKPPRLYIACDGARLNNEKDARNVSAVRDYIIENIDWECEVKTLFRDRNLGCKYSVSGAITWFFKHEESGIILEDDCLPSQSFFWFCEELLEKYKTDLRVWHIGGTNPIDSNSTSSEYYFSEYNRIWGWASWRRAWAVYDVEIKDWPAISKTGVLESLLGISESKKFTKIMWKVFDGEIDTWDYQWLLLRLLHGKAIIPNVNLISNIGFGQDATHTFDDESLLANIEKGEILFPLKHPHYLVVDHRRDDKWKIMSNKSEGLVKKLSTKLKKLKSLIVQFFLR